MIVFSKSANSDGVDVELTIVGDILSNLPIESIVVVVDKTRLSSVRTKQKYLTVYVKLLKTLQIYKIVIITTINFHRIIKIKTHLCSLNPS